MGSTQRAERVPVAGISDGVASAALQLAEQSRQESAAVAEGLRAHDAQLLDRLILQYQHRLLRYLLYLTGNLDLSEDLFQETWMRVLARGAQFRGNSQFVTWLFTIARNLVFDLRRRTTMASLEQLCDDGNHRPFEVASLDKTPFDHYAIRENGKLLSDAVSYAEAATTRGAGVAVYGRYVTRGDCGNNRRTRCDGQGPALSRTGCAETTHAGTIDAAGLVLPEQLQAAELRA